MASKAFMNLRSLFRVDLGSNRIFGLDILRALAILFVLIGHSSVYLPPHLQKLCPYIMLDGVSIFFVLSGYLIGTILIRILEKDEPTIKNLYTFWTRRWLRTLPNYYFVLTLLTVAAWFSSSHFKQLHVLDNYLFIQNLAHPTLPFFSESWSLSVEEWFYLLIPALLFLMVGLMRVPVFTSTLLIALLVILVVPAYRYYKYQHFDSTQNDLWQWGLIFNFPVATRIDSIMYGMLAALVHYYHHTFWVKSKNIFFAAGIFVLMYQKFVIQATPGYGLTSVYTSVFSFSVTTFGTMLLLPFLSEVKTGKGVFFRFFTLVSLISYSLYLSNLGIVKIAMIDILLIKNLNYFGLPLGEPVKVFVNYSLYWLFTFGISILLYKFIEIPFMNLRNRKKHIDVDVDKSSRSTNPDEARTV